MSWYAVIDSETGEAHSFGTVLADPMPAGLDSVEIEHPPGGGERWDPETREVVAVEDATPDRGAFIRAVAGIVGAQRLYAIDRDYPGFDRALREEAWDIVLAGLEAMLADEVLSQQEYADIQEAWDAAHLGRPEA